MAHGLNSLMKREIECNNKPRNTTSDGHTTTKMGSRRIFTPIFKLQVLDSYRNDADCKGNQRATARKYGIHRRQIQKWLQCETNLRSSVNNNCNKIINNNNLIQVATPLISNELNLSLELTRHSVASNTINSTSSINNTTTTSVTNHITHTSNILSPVLSYTSDQSTIPFSHESSASLSNSPVLYSNQKTIELNIVRDFSPINNTEYITTTPSTTTNYDFYYQNHHDYYFNNHHLQAPIDLSFNHRRRNDEEYINTRTPSPYDYEWKNNEKKLTDLSYPKMEAWDLSCRKRKNFDEPELSQSPTKVKLFKPYLMSDENEVEKIDQVSETKDPIIWSNYPSTTPPYPLYPSPTYPILTTNSYETPYWYGSSPGSHGYESGASVSSAYSYSGSESGDLTILTNPVAAATTTASNYIHQRQRQTYSIDFKLQTIDSYYNDVTCRGNQRAVATKYNIHRRQVQKWLQQEEDLRQRIMVT